MRLLPEVLHPIPHALVAELRSLTLRGPRAREALKVVLSVLLAVSVATALRLDDLSWAAFSGYMVIRTDFAGSLLRGLLRMAGTIGGAIIGVLLAPAVADDPLLLMISLFAVSWIGTFRSLISQYSYAWLFFGLTTSLILTETLGWPDDVLFYAATRIAEVGVGTICSLVVAALFESAGLPTAAQAQPPVAPASLFQQLRKIWHEDWLRANWTLIIHSTRSSLSIAFLPIVWRLFEVQDFAQTAVTSYVVMIVPAAVLRERQQQTIYERIAHRTLGCLLGGATAILFLGLVGDTLMPTLVAAAAGIWIGYQIQAGREGIGYLGTQFVLGFLITFVQGPAPATSVIPGLERLLGIVIGSIMTIIAIVLWPLPEDKQSIASADRPLPI